MKSRTSSFNISVLRKDVTRFAPAWGLYTVGALLVVASLRLSGSDYSFARDVAKILRYGMPIINLCYALLVVQLLFGDLYNTRMCNALHALPIRRESWFAVHTAAGICFSLIPNLVVACLAACLMGGTLAPIAFWWLLGSFLQYLFFFGLAVFCAMCVGSRFAMAVVYAILNFLSMLAWWFVDTLYTPLLYGVQTPSAGFFRLCPVVELVQRDYVDIWREFPLTAYGELDYNAEPVYHWELTGEGWRYAAVLAVIGVVLLGLAVLLYRKRKLESAGDFVAFRPVAPVFCLLYTLTVGACFQMFFTLFVGGDLMGRVFLSAGIIVGFFTGQMLLERNTRVFQWKKWAACGGIVVVVLVSMFVTGLDPLGLVRWVPEAEEVASVSVYDSFYIGGYDPGGCTVSDPEGIRQVVDIHAQHLKDDRYLDENAHNTMTLRLDYTLKSGTVRSRYYTVVEGTESFEMLRALYGRPELVLGYTDWEEYLSRVESLTIYGNDYTDQAFIEDPAQIAMLLEAVRQDCLEGDMAQAWAFRGGDNAAVINVTFTTADGSYWGRDIRIFSDSKNTLAWLGTVIGTPEVVLGYSDWEEYLSGIAYVCVLDYNSGDERYSDDPAEIAGLLEAVRQDCLDGNLWGSRQEGKECRYILDIASGDAIAGDMESRTFYLTQNCANTDQWIQANWLQHG